MQPNNPATAAYSAPPVPTTQTTHAPAPAPAPAALAEACAGQALPPPSNGTPSNAFWSKAGPIRLPPISHSAEGLAKTAAAAAHTIAPATDTPPTISPPARAPTNAPPATDTPAVMGTQPATAAAAAAAVLGAPPPCNGDRPAAPAVGQACGFVGQGVGQGVVTQSQVGVVMGHGVGQSAAPVVGQAFGFVGQGVQRVLPPRSAPLHRLAPSAATVNAHDGLARANTTHTASDHEPSPSGPQTHSNAQQPSSVRDTHTCTITDPALSRPASAQLQPTPTDILRSIFRPVESLLGPETGKNGFVQGVAARGAQQLGSTAGARGIGTGARGASPQGFTTGTRGGYAAGRQGTRGLPPGAPLPGVGKPVQAAARGPGSQGAAAGTRAGSGAGKNRRRRTPGIVLVTCQPVKVAPVAFGWQSQSQRDGQLGAGGVGVSVRDRAGGPMTRQAMKRAAEPCGLSPAEIVKMRRVALAARV